MLRTAAGIFGQQAPLMDYFNYMSPADLEECKTIEGMRHYFAKKDECSKYMNALNFYSKWREYQIKMNNYYGAEVCPIKEPDDDDAFKEMCVAAFLQRSNCISMMWRI